MRDNHVNSNFVSKCLHVCECLVPLESPGSVKEKRKKSESVRLSYSCHNHLHVCFLFQNIFDRFEDILVFHDKTLS